MCSIFLCFTALGALWFQTGFLLVFKIAITVSLVVVIILATDLYRGAR